MSILSHRSSGPRVELASHAFSVRAGELWLEVKLANAGMGEMDVDGASCDILGPTVNTLPYRLKGAASYVIVFRAPLGTIVGRLGSVTVNIGFGNGRTMTNQVRLSDAEQADLAAALLAASPLENRSTEVSAVWYPPTQEEL